MKRPAILAVLALFLLPIILGCGSPTVVTGSVTYEDQPVANGSISFLPADGKGASAGGTITGGQYRVEKLTPGKKIVQVVGVKEISFPKSSAEMQKAAEDAAKGGKSAVAAQKADEIPANAQGNNVEVDVKAGSQKLDFQLKRPAGR